MSVERGQGIAIILARSGADDAQSAFTLAATVAAMGDPAGIFVTQEALCWLRPELHENAEVLSELRHACVDADVRLYACSASLAQQGLGQADLIQDVEVVGAPTFYRFALGVGVSLYI